MSKRKSSGTRENLREKIVRTSMILKSGVRGDEFEEERLERNAVIPIQQKEGKKTFQGTLNKKSDIPLLDGTADSEEMLIRAIAMSLEEETGGGF